MMVLLWCMPSSVFVAANFQSSVRCFPPLYQNVDRYSSHLQTLQCVQSCQVRKIPGVIIIVKMTLGLGDGFPGDPEELCDVEDEVGCANNDLKWKQSCRRNENIPLLEFVQTLNFLLCPSYTLSITRYFRPVFSV